MQNWPKVLTGQLADTGDFYRRRGDKRAVTGVISQWCGRDGFGKVLQVDQMLVQQRFGIVVDNRANIGFVVPGVAHHQLLHGAFE